MKEMSSRKIIFLSIIAIILVLIANLALWFTDEIFDSEEFAQKTVQVVEREEVRDAIAAEIVDESFADQPLILQIAGNVFEPVISGLLGADILEPAIETFAQAVHTALTSKPQAITIDISSIVEFVKPLATAINERLGTQINAANIPDTIVIAEKGDIPSIYTFGVVMLWLGLFSTIIGLGLIIWLIWVNRGDKRRYVFKTIGFSLIVGAAIVLIVLQAIAATILSPIDDENLEIVASNIYDVFVGVFKWQNWILIIIGIVLIFVGQYLPDIEERYISLSDSLRESRAKRRKAKEERRAEKEKEKEKRKNEKKEP
ncbi:MAG TPA: hypothetical protein ENH57_00190 [Actinobacteria bacterium]|nr:hypothetical protein [Actinomycetota bacterium]